MSKRNSRLRGIVVMADNQEQAVEQFSAVASGEYRVLESKDGEFAIATANTDMQLLNPVDGEEMVAVPEDEKHEMVATASADGDMDAFYQACSSGCGAHVIADSIELLDKCPACASDLPKMEDADLKNKPQPKEMLVAVAATRAEAIEAFRALASGNCETFAAQCVDHTVVSNQPVNFDIFRATAAEAVENYVPQLAVASSAENGKLKVHYLVTASDDGPEMHIVSNSDKAIFCPVTSMGLVDPEEEFSDEQKAVASADFAATASDDEEEEEDDEEFDDEDEESEDDEEEDDEEEEEEDDDLEEEDDDDLSLGLAAADKPAKKGGVRKKVKPEMATASATEQETQEQTENAEQTAANVQETAVANAEQTGAAETTNVETANVEQTAQQTEAAPVEIQASFVSIAANDMKGKSVDVNYVGNVQGEPTWMAFHNGIPFAKAVASASENPATFADPSFGRAFTAVASEQGVQAALTQLRFEEIKPVLQIDQVVAEQIATQVADQGTQLAEASARDQQTLGDRMNRALATAAHGINTGYFRDTQNPIMTALASSLESIGIQGAEEMLQRAFIENSPEYHAAILAKAGEILKYDEVIQNQMAVAVTQIEPKNVVATASSAMSMGRPVQTPAQVQKQESELATASAQQSQPSNFQSKLQGLKLFR